MIMSDIPLREYGNMWSETFPPRYHATLKLNPLFIQLAGTPASQGGGVTCHLINDVGR